MQDEDQTFARCAGNPALGYCPLCKRNLKNSPVDPEAMQQWYMGPWIMEDERCPSFVEPEMTEHQKKMELDAAKRKEFAAQPKSRHLWWR